MADRRNAVGGFGKQRVAALLASIVLLPWPTAVAAVSVQVECGSSAVVEGSLQSIDGEAVVLSVAGETRRLPIADVRIVRRAAGGDAAAGPEQGVEVCGIDGLRLTGDDLAWDGPQAWILRGDDRITLPVERIRRVAWRTAGGEPAWEAAVPQSPVSDLVAVRRGDGFELVECAIVGVSAETVTGALDGERIPVKRGKVLGMVMLGQPRPAGEESLVRIAVAGGRLGGTAVSWSDDTLSVDDTIRVPGHLVESIDLAAGRTMPLVDLPVESSTSEPTFVATAAIEGLAEFFAPRIVRPDAAPPAWLMRPTSTATWRIPAGSRRFRGRVVAAGDASAAAVEVVVRADAAEAWRQRLTRGASLPLDLDVATARRLTIEVAPLAGGVGFPVRFDDAAFEK